MHVGLVDLDDLHAGPGGALGRFGRRLMPAEQDLRTGISEVFHDATGVFHHAGAEERVAGPAPDHQSYGSFISFDDPDGNRWFVQEVTTRLPGR